MKHPELNIFVECTVCTQLTDTESDSLSSLLQARRFAAAITVALGVIAIFAGAVFSRN